MPSRPTLKKLITTQRVRQLAGGVSFGRGKAYAQKGAVRSLTEHSGVLTATVRGSRDYTVRLEAGVDGPGHSCSCPVGRDGDFCKHCVAVALAWLGSGVKESDEPVPLVKLDDLRPFLLAQEKPTLATWLLNAAERDDHLRERLLRDAVRAKGKGPDFGAYRRAIDRATPDDDFIDYDETGDFTDNFQEAAIKPLQALLKDGHAADVVALAEHALRRIEGAMEQSDDSDGSIGSLQPRTPI